MSYDFLIKSETRPHPKCHLPFEMKRTSRRSGNKHRCLLFALAHKNSILIYHQRTRSKVSVSEMLMNMKCHRLRVFRLRNVFHILQNLHIFYSSFTFVKSLLKDSISLALNAHAISSKEKHAPMKSNMGFSCASMATMRRKARRNISFFFFSASFQTNKPNEKRGDLVLTRFFFSFFAASSCPTVINPLLIIIQAAIDSS